MPELAEVEAYRRFFDRRALDREITAVSCPDALVVGTLGRPTLSRVLPGRAFQKTRRHGKYLFALAAPSGDARRGRPLWVVFHFGMSGSLASIAPREAVPRHARVVFRFAGGSALVFVCPRRLGRVAWLRNPGDLIESKELGPDPLEPGFGVDPFRRALDRRRGAIKAVLLDQTAVAGIGNLYADEALFQSGIHPRRIAATLQPQEWRRLHRSLDRVLRTAIASNLAETGLPRRWLLPLRREGGPCPRCGASLARAVVGGRTTYYCSRHQPAGDTTRSTSRRHTNRKGNPRGSPPRRPPGSAPFRRRR